MNEQREEKKMNLESTLTPKVKEPGFWRELWQQARLVYYLMRDPDVPFYLKLLPVTSILYFLFPFDLLPDLVPVVGQLDDITALLVGAKVFIELAPPAVVAKHMQKIREADGFLATESTNTLRDDVANAIIIDAEHEIVVENKNDQN
ncbi:MAG: DUF1232 domain-containing protein [Chloroflexi bacterium]|nr:DUF1232 domain-containing protein [Chloroflexota bacterium]